MIEPLLQTDVRGVQRVAARKVLSGIFWRLARRLGEMMRAMLREGTLFEARDPVV